MKATILRYLRSAGSILDIAPSTDYTKIMKNQGDQQALKNDFYRIGGDFGRAITVANASKPQTAK